MQHLMKPQKHRVIDTFMSSHILAGTLLWFCYLKYDTMCDKQA